MYSEKKTSFKIVRMNKTSNSENFKEKNCIQWKFIDVADFFYYSMKFFIVVSN